MLENTLEKPIGRLNYFSERGAEGWNRERFGWVVKKVDERKM